MLVFLYVFQNIYETFPPPPPKKTLKIIIKRVDCLYKHVKYSL